MDHIAHSLATFISGRGRADDVARWEARRRLIDSLSLAAVSQDDRPVAIARSLATPAATGVSLWGLDDSIIAQDAILANGVAVRYRDMNDTYFGAEALHPSDMIPALCAVAEEEAADLGHLLDAICVAYDVAVDMADNWRTAPRGFDHVNLIGFGVVAGVAHLRGLDSEAISRALRIVATSLVATRQTRKGHLSMWKGYAAANQSVGAYRAVRLAQAGVDGPPLAFVGEEGFLAGVVDNADLDTPWERPTTARHDRRILDTHLKVFPLGYLAQGPAQLAASLHPQIRDADQVKALRIHTYRRASEIMGDPQKWHIDSPETADHSLPYVTLVGLIDGLITAESMHRERWSSPDVERLLPQVSVIIDSDMTAAYPAEMAARVEVDLVDGTTLTAQSAWPRGNARNPLSDDELLARSTSLLNGVTGWRPDIAQAWHAADDDPVAPLWRADA